jgi:hypothetical protein
MTLLRSTRPINAKTTELSAGASFLASSRHPLLAGCEYPFVVMAALDAAIRINRLIFVF